uniref:Chemosensory protein 3 n=1 Tax=Subpsaltria yangi TaxID=1195109 RepID=A0A385IUQ1_9HEMI|nr:chemosensory protein 3 [Subpsaltria yangi]
MVGTALVVYVSAVCWCCWLSVGAMGSTPPPHTKHSSLDNINKTLDNVLNNPRLRENYIRCFLDKGICSKEALQLKHILSDALNMNCTNCTADQKYAAEKFLKYIVEKEPTAWTRLKSKYDSKLRDNNSDESKENHDDNSKGHRADDDHDDDEQSHGQYHSHDHGNSNDNHGTKGKNSATNKLNNKNNATMPTVVKT